MDTILILIQPWRRSAAARVDIRLGDSGSGEGFGLGGFEWEPAISQRPVLSQEIMALELDGKVLAGKAGFAINLANMPNVFRPLDLDWQGAPVQIWSAADFNYGARRLEFKGVVESSRPDLDTLRVVLDASASTAMLEKPLLTEEFSGGGDEDGEPQMHAVLKPAGFGLMTGIEPVWFDETHNIGMIDGYGNTLAITRLLEGGSEMGAPFDDYATYADLKQAIIDKVIQPGFWGTCVAEGMIGLGAPPVGVMTVEAEFAADTPGTWALRVLEIHAEVDMALIDTASFTDLDDQMEALFGAYPQTGWWTRDQRQVKDVLELIAGSCNATILVSLAGTVTVSRGVASAPVATLDRTGSTEPRVINWKPAATVAPFYELKARTARPARVLSRDEVNFVDRFVPMGLWDSDDTYRIGNTVYMTDGSEWLYINDEPSAGNSPPTDGSESNTWWQRLKDSDADGGFIQPEAPTAGRSVPGSIWLDSDDGYRSYTRVPGSGLLSLGGNRIILDGGGILLPWTHSEDQRFSDLSDDGNISVDEKKRILIRDEASREAVWPILDAQAAALGVTTARTAASEARAAWLAMRDAIVPAWDDETAPSPVNRTLFRTLDLAYDEALASLQDAITGRVTTVNQVSITMPPIPSIVADYQGTINVTQFNKIITPAITSGGVSVRTDGRTTYAIANISSGGTGAVSVDNVAGSADKGRITITSAMTATFTFDFTVTFDGVAQAPIKVTITVVPGPAPTGTSTSGGGAGNKAGSDSTLDTVTSVAYVQISDIIQVEKAAGEKIRGAAPLDYEYYRLAGGGSNRLGAKWRYSAVGAGVWNDFDASPKSGSVSTYDAGAFYSSPGSIQVTQEVTPANGTWDVALFAAMLDSAVGNIQIVTGVASISVGP